MAEGVAVRMAAKVAVKVATMAGNRQNCHLAAGRQSGRQFSGNGRKGSYRPLDGRPKIGAKAQCKDMLKVWPPLRVVADGIWR